jgi:hypothetical protein
MSGCELESDAGKNMQKTLMLFLSVVGVALATADSAFARGANLPLRSGAVTPTEPASFLKGSVGSYYLALAANHESRGTATATFNASVAILAGVFTLMLLQRRNPANTILKPSH